MAKIQSVEPNIADLANGWMRSYKLDYKLEQESLNTEIDQALNEYHSKNGGVGGNRPDAKLLLQDKNMVNYPVLIEYKGYKDKLVALDSEGKVANKTAKNQPDFKHINSYAVNGAVHYANALLHYTSYTDIIAIGMTGYKTETGKLKHEIGVYYVSKSNFGIGQKIDNYTDFSFLKKSNFDKFIEKVKRLKLTPDEIEKLKEQREREINASLVKLNNDIYQNEKGLSERDRVYLVAASIIATLGVPGRVAALEKSELKSSTETGNRDGDIILRKIKAFLDEKNLPQEKRDMIVRTLQNTLTTDNINKVENGESQLKRVFTKIAEGKAQLPDFQRGWVWDDNRIKALILSVIHNYPVGAAMFLSYGNESIHFKHKPIEGSPNQNKDVAPDELILDGQQRLTSLYNALYSKNAVHTKTDKGKLINRFYYLSIDKALDLSADDEEIVISVPESRQITSDFGRHIDLDLSARNYDFEHKMFPLNIILDTNEQQKWQNEYYEFHKYDPAVIQQFTKLFSTIISPTQRYKMPVILLDKDTPKEAVCQVFENVNTGGVSLTVFELVTAIFAMDNFQLRQDWEDRQRKYFSGDILNIVTATDFLTALTLLSSFKSGGTVSCKKKDVLALPLQAYKQYADDLCKGFVIAEKLLMEERIFSSRDLPYSTQLIPLSAICTVLMTNNKINTTNVKNKVKQWYWCGVFGELYGSANETRYANDIAQVICWITNEGDIPKTVTDFFFNPTRLLSLQSRQSAAYKGIMAMILKNHAMDFISGAEMDFSTYSNEKIDIHHIFPKDYCVGQHYDKIKWNSIINKTPIAAASNREIGGVAPSAYLKKLEKKGSVSADVLDKYVESHWINHVLLRQDAFQDFIIDRAKRLLNAIEKATGRTISGKDSDEVIQQFGASLT